MKLRKEEIPIAIDLPVATFRVAEWDDTAVAFVEMKAGADATPLLPQGGSEGSVRPYW